MSEILQPGQKTLSELAETANREHAAVERSAGDMLTHAILAGESLLAARDSIERGKWLKWREENFNGSRRLATMYMELARRKTELAGQGFQTMRAARHYLERTAFSKRDQAALLRAEARHLYRDGAPISDLATQFEVAPATIRGWLRSDTDRRASDHRTNRRRALARKALERQERDRLAKREGGDIGKAYAAVRRLAQTLEKAFSDATDSDSRHHLDLALRRLYGVEDLIASALKQAPAEPKVTVKPPMGEAADGFGGQWYPE